MPIKKIGKLIDLMRKITVICWFSQVTFQKNYLLHKLLINNLIVNLLDVNEKKLIYYGKVVMEVTFCL